MTIVQTTFQQPLRRLIVLALTGVLATPVFARQARPNAAEPGRCWVGTWASSPQRGDAKNAPPAPGFADSTLRQIVHVSIGGERLRVRFSNAFGTSPLTIASAHVALTAGGSAIRPESDKALTFDGQPSVTIPAGALMISDPVDFNLPPLSDLAVTIFLRGAPDGITTHPGSRETSYLVAGNAVSAQTLPGASQADHWYFLNGVDVFTQASGAAVVILGDSITDGHGSTTNGNDRWPDDLARRLQANRATADIGVLNEGIGGNRLLQNGLGPNALARLDRDVLAQTGVRWLIVLEGINDIGTRTATAQQMIEAYQQIILRAHAHDIRVYGATIMPYGGSFYFSTGGEAIRQVVNRWIRTSGRFDGVIDMDQAMRDPHDPSQLSPATGSRDHLHPGPQGYRVMSDAVSLRIFTAEKVTGCEAQHK
jgi:lysophospholipase L1-like esterase